MRNGVETRPAGHNSRHYSLNEHFFDDLSNEYTAYLLGFIYADGSINKETLTIALSVKDILHLEKIRSLFDYNVDLRHYSVKTPQKKMKEAVRLCVHSKHLTTRLKELGIIKGRGKFELTLEKLPKESYRHFIRGLVDGDGCLDGKYRLRILGQEDILTWVIQVFHQELELPLRLLRQREHIMELEYYNATKAIIWLYQDAKIFLGRKINRMEWWNKKEES